MGCEGPGASSAAVLAGDSSSAFEDHRCGAAGACPPRGVLRSKWRTLKDRKRHAICTYGLHFVIAIFIESVLWQNRCPEFDMQVTKSVVASVPSLRRFGATQGGPGRLVGAGTPMSTPPRAHRGPGPVSGSEAHRKLKSLKFWRIELLKLEWATPLQG